MNIQTISKEEIAMMKYNGKSNRGEWEFEYAASSLLPAATARLKERQAKVEFWKKRKEAVAQEIQAKGIEISQGVAAELNYTSNLDAPSVRINSEMERNLLECHKKVEHHQAMADEYAAWVKLFSDRSSERVKLTYNDHLYFFGRD